MLNYFKGANVYQIIVWSIIIVGTIVSILPPDMFFFRIVSRFVVQIMITYLVLGMLFLFLSEEKSMFISFICCGILCLFLRTRPPFFAPPQAGATISVATFNLSLSNESFDSTISTIFNTGADIISLQEVTPDWHRLLQSNPSIKENYPYDTTILRLDFHGLAIYSRYPFVEIDTFNFGDIPNLIGCIKHDSLKQHIYFLSSHTTPPVSLSAFENINLHLQQVADTVRTKQKPILVFGDYQVMPWSSEIIRFRQRAKLNDSRRDISPNYFPHDHIFYSDLLECVDFKSLGDKNTNHLGVMGRYQLNNEL